MEFPAGVLGAALGTILLPSLSKHHASGSPAEYSRLLDWGLRLTLMLALPAAAALAVLALPLVATLFHYGRFTDADAWMTREALVAYSLGLVGLILVKILAPGFYARQNVATPVKIGLATLAATQLMNLAFIGPFKHAGLALAIGLGACLNAFLLFLFLRKQDIYTPQPGWFAFALKIVVAVAVMATVLWTAMGPNADWLRAAWHWRLGMLAGLVALGLGVYAACLLALGFRLRQFSIKGAD
jgi:putative peptidoglycan lipid II flippase